MCESFVYFIGAGGRGKDHIRIYCMNTLNPVPILLCRRIRAGGGHSSFPKFMGLLARGWGSSG